MTHHRSSFLHQFSSDEQDLLQVYLGLFVMYCILTPLQLHATQKQVHPIAKLLALGRHLQHLPIIFPESVFNVISYITGLCIQFLALALICLHYGLFAVNGQGIKILSVLGEVLAIISQSLFMLLLLLLAMGWAITRQELNCKFLLFGLWSAYTLLSCLLYVWMKVKVFLNLQDK